MASSSPTRTKVFISYSHADVEWLQRLKRHLYPLVREGRMEWWDDTHIRPGDDWHQEFRSALDRAQAAVLLISADFFASDYIDENEVPPLLVAAQAKGVRILPVIVSASRFARNPNLARFQTVNSPDQPLNEMSAAEQEKVLDRLARTIEDALNPAAIPQVERRISVQNGNALDFTCDVLVLKYAQGLHGADRAAFEQMSSRQAINEDDLPAVGRYLCLPTHGSISAKWVLFVGTRSLIEFEYGDIRNFAKRSLEICASEIPDARKIALTLHGVNIGLDEREALFAEVVGLNEAISEGLHPSNLQMIVILERDPRRADRLRQALENMASGEAPLLVDAPAAGSPDAKRTGEVIAFEGTRQSVGQTRRPGAKPSIFVAMPFAAEMDDTFFYGIQKPIEQIGYLCERADLAIFTGDVMTWVRGKIGSSELVVADLTDSNPNVYLEVGFAWGIGKPTVLLMKKGSELRFDVRSHRCLVYGKIRELEEMLANELRGLLSAARKNPGYRPLGPV